MILLGKVVQRCALRCINIGSKHTAQRQFSTRLAEVGRFEGSKVFGKYEAGQLFLHKVFGYRGVILFPWVAKLFNSDVEKLKPSTGHELGGKEKKDDDVDFSYMQIPDESNSTLKHLHTTYYQALIDQRDCPYIRAQPEAVTFLGNQKDTSLYAIPGLDYVSHEDILPYTTSDQMPIEHDLFDRFLNSEPYKVPSFGATESLRVWHEKNHVWLELSNVYKETTDNIRVTVIPFYMGSRKIQHTKSFWWRYSIRLENLGEDTIQLRERHWKIFSLSGTLETVRGRGIVGQEPVLSPRQPAFQYSSHVSLQAPSGHMWGTYRMEKGDGTMFDIRIPPFSLESKDNDGSPTI